MARKRRSQPYQVPPRVPRAVPSGPGGTRTAVAQAEVGVAGPSVVDLQRLYSYVRRDLARIAVLAIAMFIFIFLTTLILL